MLRKTVPRLKYINLIKRFIIIFVLFDFKDVTLLFFSRSFLFYCFLSFHSLIFSEAETKVTVTYTRKNLKRLIVPSILR